jgi:hypothetical protein
MKTRKALELLEYQVQDAYLMSPELREAVHTLRDALEHQRELEFALSVAAKYLAKAVAEDLMTNCVRPPRYALDLVRKALGHPDQGMAHTELRPED